ncbi:dehydrogenase [Parvularcula bermudensis HTCC2503]|uniref:Dehydrogenase n=1 Tax=Parvularcula bermudensis (strain ATCC BAA-594 / HTCC2503 / KCTC 12087) TaxID=314260 RepID=E0TFP8_PARBH|nr:PQQ-dependent sugar dehydrogenase [Parvularcula bermudensis]ADM09063.1 dehydrogenase [Parvularcula bermudensis HTCC2503]
MRSAIHIVGLSVLMSLPACSEEPPSAQGPAEGPFDVEVVAQFTQPWAMTFLPDGRFLVTEKPGSLKWGTQEGFVSDPIEGVPSVDYGGQGGLGDVIVHPDFADNGLVYLSFVEAGEDNTRGAAVMRARLSLTEKGGALSDETIIWRQTPKVTGRGHYSHRLLFSPDGDYLFITSGDRQEQAPAQDLSNTLGAVIRLTPEGEVPEDNPFADKGGVTAQIWSYGHRNMLGIAFDADGVLWEHEMGPRGGDEFQRIDRGANYGWPEVSYGDNYNGVPIPPHEPRDPTYRHPDEWWNPVISPSGMVIYQGEAFPTWQGSALIGGLSSESLIRVSFDCELSGREICEAERFNMGQRIREVEEGTDGTVFLLEDQRSRGGAGGRLLKLTPAG